jgi:large subunit ribosomal protein L15
MPHKKRKVRKKRGSRTHGYGRVGQHRGRGQRGGTGKAGRRKHKGSYVSEYEPDYFEKRGFRPPKRKEMNAINVGELDEQVDRLLDEKKVIRRKDGIHINLKELGYGKLLGSGEATHPLIVDVDLYSSSAVKKIKEAKGRIVKTG